jgi:hypothetical protein
MKNIFLTIAILTAALTARADGLKQNLLPENTRWLLHLDGEAFRKTRIGAMIIEDKAEEHIRRLKEDTKLDLDFSFKKVNAITAFGPRVGEQNDGVLLIQTSADLRGDLERLIAFKEEHNGQPPVSRVSANGVEMYKLGEDVNAMQASDRMWLIGKNKTTLLTARDVINGKAPALKDAKFLNYPTLTNSFFFIAMADTGSAGDKLPAQAQILKKAEGGRVSIGENGDRLLLNLALRAPDSDTIQKMQQLAQGIIALVTLSQSENKDLITLVNSASVSTNESYLSINLSFPLQRAMQHVRERE